MRNILVVGAGITGITCARILAEKGYNITIIDKNSYVGGACFDEYNEYGINIHKFGPHIFRTNNKETYSFITKFGDFNYYQHRVLSFVNGQTYEFPLNKSTLSKILSSEEIDKIINKNDKKSMNNFEDAMIHKIGKTLYELFYKNYSYKQWGLSGTKLLPTLAEIIPFRENYDNRYFSHKYQGIPIKGYSHLFRKMLNHPNIHILLNVSYNSLKDPTNYFYKIIYTGKIDEFFNYKLGILEYKSINIQIKTFNQMSYQDAAVVNYPNDYDFLRITEFKKFTDTNSTMTTIGIEYPSSDGIPLYCIPDYKNMKIYRAYKNLTKQYENIYFIGRLAEYTNINMGQTIENCIEMLKGWEKV